MYHSKKAIQICNTRKESVIYNNLITTDGIYICNFPQGHTLKECEIIVSHWVNDALEKRLSEVRIKPDH